MNTLFLLMAQYHGQAIVSLSRVCTDYFTHLTPANLRTKVSSGEIDLLIVSMELNEKTARGIHLSDLADYIDRQRDRAKLELDRTRKQATKSLSQEPREVEKPEADTFSRPRESNDLSRQPILFIRLAEVKRITGMSTSTIYKMVSQSTFPRQVKLGGRAVAWVRVEVIEWCDLRIKKSRMLKSEN